MKFTYQKANKHLLIETDQVIIQTIESLRKRIRKREEYLVEQKV